MTDKIDSINPDHYTFGCIETISYLEAKMTSDEFRGFLKGNILKYVSREAFRHKWRRGLEEGTLVFR